MGFCAQISRQQLQTRHHPVPLTLYEWEKEGQIWAAELYMLAGCAFRSLVCSMNPRDH